jgi:hypothetical protein
MAVVTIDAKGELEAVRADIDRQTAVEDLERGAASKATTETKTPDPDTKDAKTETKPTEGETTDPDDVEGDDGLTPRQRREFNANVVKRIAKKHREMKEAEEFAAAQYSEKRLAEQRAERAERELAELRGKAQPAQAAATEPAKPERAKFATDQEFLDAMIAWGVEEAMKKRAQEEAKQAAERRQAEIIETAKARIAKALQAVPDFAEVTGAADIEVPPVVAGYMQKSPMFAEIGYHLAKNPDVLRSLAKLEPDEQLVTIGKIESTLKPFEVADPKSAAAKDSNGATPGKTAESTNGEQRSAADTGISPGRARDAAPVIRPLNGSGASPVEVDPRDMNIRETIADWQKRNHVNLSLRKRH